MFSECMASHGIINCNFIMAPKRSGNFHSFWQLRKQSLLYFTHHEVDCICKNEITESLRVKEQKLLFQLCCVVSAKTRLNNLLLHQRTKVHTCWTHQCLKTFNTPQLFDSVCYFFFNFCTYFPYFDVFHQCAGSYKRYKPTSVPQALIKIVDFRLSSWKKIEWKSESRGKRRFSLKFSWNIHNIMKIGWV